MMVWWQAALLVAAAGAAAAWVFRLTVRPPRVGVASLLLWRTVLAERRELSWWERVRRAVSLALTVLVAAALAFALARPAPAAGERGRVLLVLDSSVSMQARTGAGGTRWASAVAALREVAARSGAVVLATTADGIVAGPTADRSLLDAALAGVGPAGGDAGSWPHLDGVDAVHFFTDGAVARPLVPGVEIHSVHEPAPNVAITAFGSQPATSAANGAQAYLEIANYATTAQAIHATVTRGTALLFDRQTSLGPGEVLRQVLPLAPAGGPRLHARVSAASDALAIDNEAVAWVEEAGSRIVGVVAEQPGRLVSLLERDRSLTVRVMAPSEYRADAADVFVFDGWVPSTPPARPALVVAPPDVAWLGRRDASEPQPEWVARLAHPVLLGADVLTLTLTRARGYVARDMTVAASTRSGLPLVSVRDRADSRLVLFGFDLQDAALESSPGFLVLVGNALEWLARPSVVSPGPPGPRRLPASTTSVTAPSGRPVPLIRTGDAVVARFDQPGLYLVQVGGARAVAVVNVTSPEASNLEVTAHPGASRATWAAAGLGGRPRWTYLVWLALGLVVLEWWTWHRRVTV